MEDKEVAINEMEPRIKQEILNKFETPKESDPEIVKTFNFKDLREDRESKVQFIVEDKFHIDDIKTSILKNEKLEEEECESFEIFDDLSYTSTPLEVPSSAEIKEAEIEVAEIEEAENEEAEIEEAEIEEAKIEEEAISDHLAHFKKLSGVQSGDEDMEYIISEIVDIEAEEPSIEEENSEELLELTLLEFEKDLEDIEDIIFDEDPANEGVNQLKECQKMLKHLEGYEKQIQKILSVLDKYEKVCISMKKANLIITKYFNKIVKKFKLFEDKFAEFKGDIGDIKKTKNWKIKGAEMARVILEAEDIDSLGLEKKNDVLLLSKDDLEFLNSKFLIDDEQGLEEGVPKKAVRKTKGKGAVGKKDKAMNKPKSTPKLQKNS